MQGLPAELRNYLLQLMDTSTNEEMNFHEKLKYILNEEILQLKYNSSLYQSCKVYFESQIEFKSAEHQKQYKQDMT